MEELIGVRSSQSEVKVLEVNVDTVYIRSNIKRISTDDFEGWKYDEKQLNYAEYLQLLGDKIL